MRALLVLVVAIELVVVLLLGIVVVTTSVGLLVCYRWTVSILISFVVDDLCILEKKLQFGHVCWGLKLNYLFATIGQQYVISANGTVTISGLHVSEIIA